MKNIVLIGFMGTGKSAVGRRLAARLGRQFVDTDEEIERVTGRTVAQLFAREGEVRFRSEEALVVKKVAARAGLVVATGGGAVLTPANVETLKQNGILIGLTTDPEIIFHRVRRKKDRPLLNGAGDLQTRIKEMLAARADAYGVAEFTVDTGRHGQEETVELIVKYLQERCQSSDR
ncbi:shikimate kinase [Desulfotomaculum copahuensis]|uniref:Shikimate kinase n=1 Tax=Desulfotomaculum copahuensis TaxID=1838280 RepID=A0A1B7LBL4_9FIRM|nr:shikimate kinase [Desulfotomaculum copahuensis]OAT79880.1 shikimate kinase [Desulfotomaculum copahuensis]